MEFTNRPKDAEIHDKIKSHSLDHCVLVFVCSKCGLKLDPIDKNDKNINSFTNGIINDNICPNCKFKFSKCSVCLCPINLSKKSDNKCIVFCNKCSHGGHYDHYKGWFKEFNECPNSKCNCRCQQEEDIK